MLSSQFLHLGARLLLTSKVLTRCTRGHKAALVKEQCKLDMRKYSFSQRVINEWNKLPNDSVNASSVNMFKNRIDRYLIRAATHR